MASAKRRLPLFPAIKRTIKCKVFKKWQRLASRDSDARFQAAKFSTCLLNIDEYPFEVFENEAT